MNTVNTNKNNVRNGFFGVLILSLAMLIGPMVQCSWGCSLSNAGIWSGCRGL